ncbi:MAG: HAD family hydrolase [Gemmatimonadetes bacterium]|nr:HAD family hydrolase [Gemmatimonadota bacterium]
MTQRSGPRLAGDPGDRVLPLHAIDPETSLILFDLDGTLFSGAEATVTAVQDVFEKYGVPCPPRGEILSFFGIPTAEFQKWLADLCDAHGAGAPGEEIASEVIVHENDLVPSRGTLFPGVPDMLEELTGAGFTLGICTNGEQPYVGTVLKSQHIEKYFHGVRHRQCPEDEKPEMAMEIASAFPALTAVAFVGDRADDVACARRIGAKAVGCLYGFGRDGELDEADFVIERIGELRRVLRRIGKWE